MHNYEYIINSFLFDIQNHDFNNVIIQNNNQNNLEYNFYKIIILVFLVYYIINL